MNNYDFNGRPGRFNGAFAAFGDFLRGPDAGELGVPGTPVPGAPLPGGDPVAPWQRQDAIDAGIAYRRVPIWPPFANLARDPSVAYLVRFRPFTFGGNGVAAGAQAPQPCQFSQPTIVFARSAAAIDAAGAALPVGLNALDTFSFYMIRTNADSIDGTTTPVLGSALLGTGQQPALLAGNGLFFNNGAALTINVTTLRANIRVDIVLWTIEEYGNPGRPGGGR